jgi:hypothetical protein
LSLIRVGKDQPALDQPKNWLEVKLDAQFVLHKVQKLSLGY